MTIKSSQILVEEAMQKIKTLDPTEAFDLAKNNKCILVDIRDIRELWSEGTINDSMHIPRGMLEFWLDPNSPYYKREKFEDSTKKILLFCAGGMRSALAARTMQEMGYENVAHISGGFAAMEQTGFKVIKKDKK